MGQVRLRLATDDHVADLRGPNLCAVITPDLVEAVTSRLGPDPLRPEPDPDLAWRKIARSGKSIAELLMDQSVLAGVGNVYRCEVLFRQRVDPFRPGREIRRTTWDAIWLDLVDLLPLGVATGKIVTVAEQVDAGARRGRQRAQVDRLDRADVLRLQAPGRALPGLRVADPHPGRGGTKPVLVRALPAPPLSGPAWHRVTAGGQSSSAQTSIDRAARSHRGEAAGAVGVEGHRGAVAATDVDAGVRACCRRAGSSRTARASRSARPVCRRRCTRRRRCR